ncbi:hypothetical protein ACFL96_07540 [Thermoproteota archaeon]
MGDELKIIVIADDDHRIAFDSLFRTSPVDLDYICEVARNPGKSLAPDNVRDYLASHGEDYDAVIMCGCCGDSLHLVTDKELFPGKVMFFNYHQIHEDAEPRDDIPKKVDLYVDGVQKASVLLPKLNGLLGI